VTEKKEWFAKAPDEIKNRFLTAIKRGTDEMMLAISDQATETLAQQTSETYLQNIADAFTHNPDTTVVWSPEYNAEGQLVLTLKEDRQGTDASYQLIFGPDGTVTRTNVSLTMDDTDHPVDFVRNGQQVITTGFPHKNGVFWRISSSKLLSYNIPNKASFTFAIPVVAFSAIKVICGGK
jgi:hypothetical protein